MISAKDEWWDYEMKRDAEEYYESLAAEERKEQEDDSEDW